MEPVEIVDVSLPVNQFVSWVSIDIEIMFNCFLLAFGQIVVNAVLTSQIVHLIVFFHDSSGLWLAK